MLIINPDHLKPGHLFSVENITLDEKVRKKTMLPGHMAETFINNKDYQVMYLGPNSTERMVVTPTA